MRRRRRRLISAQTRDVAAFTRIDNRDSVDVQLHVGEPQNVTVRAGKKVIEDVHTVVRDGTLRVTFDHHGFGSDDVVVEASVPKLTAVEASGSGDMDPERHRRGRVRGPLDGSADITVDGSATRLAVALDG